MQKSILRWVCCSLVVSVAALAHADDTRAAEGSWVGKRVIRKAPDDLELRIVDKKGNWQVVGKMEDATVTVQKEDGAWVKVRSGGVEGWIAKADVMLIEDGIKFFTDWIRANPDDAWGYGMRAIVWEEKDELDLALKDYNEAIRLAPDSSNDWNNRGFIWMAKEDYEKAIRDFNQAIRLDPENYMPVINRGRAWNAKKEYDKAIEDFDKSLRLERNNSWAYANRGVSWTGKKEYAKAQADFAEALRLEPQSPFTLRQAAWFWATCPDEKYRDAKKALQAAKKACEACDSKYFDCVECLAAAYAEAGDFEQAVKHQKKAKEMPGIGKTAMVELNERLRLYQSGKPVRQE